MIMTQQELDDLFSLYKSLCPDALFYNHYELETKTKIDADTWKEFLAVNTIANWIQSELAVIRKSEMAKIVQDVSESKSVGQAQLITALQKIDQEHTVKTGPAFIYMYVPLDEQQVQAENVQQLERDPFRR